MAPKDSASQARLAKALRENLKRRKTAQRARANPASDVPAKDGETRPNKAQKPD